jgi:hypothetical protein
MLPGFPGSGPTQFVPGAKMSTSSEPKLEEHLRGNVSCCLSSLGEARKGGSWVRSIGVGPLFELKIIGPPRKAADVRVLVTIR